MNPVMSTSPETGFKAIALAETKAVVIFAKPRVPSERTFPNTVAPVKLPPYWPAKYTVPSGATAIPSGASVPPKSSSRCHNTFPRESRFARKAPAVNALVVPNW